jgi:hypothetical protein
MFYLFDVYLIQKEKSRMKGLTIRKDRAQSLRPKPETVGRLGCQAGKM